MNGKKIILVASGNPLQAKEIADRFNGKVRVIWCKTACGVMGKYKRLPGEISITVVCANMIAKNGDAFELVETLVENRCGNIIVGVGNGHTVINAFENLGCHFTCEYKSLLPQIKDILQVLP